MGGGKPDQTQPWRFWLQLLLQGTSSRSSVLAGLLLLLPLLLVYRSLTVSCIRHPKLGC